MSIQVDVSALEQSVLIFKKLRERPSVPMENVGIYLKSPGIFSLRGTFCITGEWSSMNNS